MWTSMINLEVTFDKDTFCIIIEIPVVFFLCLVLSL